MPSFYSLLRYFSFQSPQIRLSLKEKYNPMFNSFWAACIRQTHTVKKAKPKSPPLLELYIAKDFTFFLSSEQANEAQHPALRNTLFQSC